MSEPKLISPLLDDFIIGGAISEHNGVRCFPAMKNNSDTRYILKVISIPASQVQLDALLLTGAYKTREAALEYFAQLAQGVQDEVAVLSRLSKLEGFLTYEAFQVVAKEEETGFDIYLLGVYRRSLQRHFRKCAMTHLAAVNLGLDMCASLAVCRQSGYLYADLKPGNIFISDENEYRIGDLGFLNIVGLKYASLPDRYRSQYTAPELADPLAPISPTIDIYAAGLILYQAYNGGVLPFEGAAPSEPLPAPIYADYEMSEIILKACAPDPADRWEDPIKMGQALVGYMQRNGVNDTPIVPPSSDITQEPEEEPVPFEDEPDEALEDQVLFEQADAAGQMMIEQMLDYDSVMSTPEQTEEETEEETEEDSIPEESSDTEEDPGNLSFLDTLVNDETAPQEEMADQIVYSELSDDANNILSVVDDLIAHEPPAPAVAPEPIDVPVPPPIIAEPEPEPEPEPADETPPESSEESADAVDEAVAAISEAVASTDTPVDPEIPADISLPDPKDVLSEQEYDADHALSESEDAPAKKNTTNRLLSGLLILIIIGCIAVAGFIFYRDYYMKTIDDMQIKGVDNHLTVSVSTKADHDLLTIVCTDTYGNKLTAPVENGFATFTDLTPDTLYTITVDIKGFHGVTGDVKATYTTSPQTEIMSFHAVTGAEPGTVILNFTIKGHDYKEWVVTYEAADEPAQSITFSGHMTTITGLSVGKTYTITLDAANNGFVVGQNTLEYASVDLIYPESLNVTEFSAEKLRVTWQNPENTQVEQWTVLCYNDTGYSQNITTAELSAEFTDIDPTASYTVEVTAAGMSVGSRFYISKNSVAVSSFQATPNGNYLDISWEYAGPQPTAEWVLTYTIDDMATETVVPTSGTSGRIENIVPGARYGLKLQLNDGTTVINGVFAVDVPEAEPFEGYQASAAGMTWQMCAAPDAADWNWWDIRQYQNTFAVGEKAGFVARLSNRYGVSDDPITVLYVIRDSAGAIVSTASATQSWTSMWYQYYGEFTVPQLPQTPGEYTMEIYFNGAAVHEQAFTITQAS